MTMPESIPVLGMESVAKLRALVETFKSGIELPQIGAWKSMNDDTLWLTVVRQVGVVGRAEPAAALFNAMTERDPGWYSMLIASNDSRRATEINKVLHEFGVRYASEDSRKCRKTHSLINNLLLMHSRGGPRAYVEHIAQVDSEYARVGLVSREMAYIKNKGARDWLIGLGLLRNALAFDVRLLNALKYLGADLPDKLQSNIALYRKVEAELIEKVCRPCDVTGAVLDRILFQRYNEIVPIAARRKKAKPRLASAKKRPKN